MIASNVKRETLESASASIGVRLDITTLNQKGTRHRVKVFPIVPDSAFTKSGRRKRGERGDARYQRTSFSFMHNERRVAAVCWHGFRDFFRAVFAIEADAKFATALDTWNGAADFEARYRESGTRNAGAPIAPVCHAEACRCGEQGMAV